MCAILRFSVYEKSHLGQSHRLYFADACALCPVHGITTDDRDWGGWSLIGTVVGTCTYVSMYCRSDASSMYPPPSSMYFVS